MNPRFGIPQLSFPHLSYCEMFGALGNGMVSKAEGEEPVYDGQYDQVKRFLTLGDNLVFAAGGVGSNVVLKKTRDSTVAWVDDNPNAPNHQERMEIIQAVTGMFAKVNRDKFQMDLDGFEPVQYTAYNLNQHYDWHTDTHEGMESDAHRKLSVVVFLTNPDEYEGGELELNLNGNPEDTKLLRPAAGTAVFFYSHVPHRVRPVTSGKRRTLVAWALGPKLR